MPFDLFIFDFDGTLVDSAEIKRTAFFDLFRGDVAAQDVVRAVLSEDPEGSREQVIRAMLRRMGVAEGELDVSSNTPESVLNRFLQRRGWLPFLNGMAGHPAHKTLTARRLLAEHDMAPSRTVVIGDGESDRNAARDVGANFIPIRAAGDLKRLGALWGIEFA
jgi:phosphoglycolate phosphatase-like HAD superfamily hydrolase